MAISSVSRVYDAPDPIMENDLELLAKVNTFQQTEFNAGAKDLQNEVDKWSLLANQAKPQDRQYVNAKLNNLVAGINNLGGVNLRDPNNVNELKSLGYNVYGDQKIRNATITTQAYQTYLQDRQAKLSGKNAKDYDPVYADYLQNKWGAWLDDGQVGTSFNGPTSLPQGSFQEYQTRVDNAVNKLVPDSNDVPQSDSDAALNYLQVGNKYIRKERIKNLIGGMTTAQDYDIINAHAWKNMGGYNNDQLVDLTNAGYDSQIDELKQTRNDLIINREKTNDFDQKNLYDKQIKQIDDGLKQVGGKKNDLNSYYAQNELTPEERQSMMSNLYFNAYTDQYATAKSYQQDKTELKSNQAAIANMREMGINNRWSYDYALRAQLVGIKEMLAKEKLAALGLNGAGLPGEAKSFVPVNPKGDVSQVFGNDDLKQADVNLIQTSNSFLNNAYKSLNGSPVFQKYLVADANGNYVPKDDQSRKILDKAIQSKIVDMEKLAKTPVSERKNNGIDPLDSNDQTLWDSYQDFQNAKLYKGQLTSVQEGLFRDAGLESPTQKLVNINFNDGTHINLPYSKLKNMIDIAEKYPESKEAQDLKKWGDKAASGNKSSVEDSSGILDKNITSIKNTFKDLWAGLTSNPLEKKTTATSNPGYSSLEEAVDNVSNYYSRINDGWKDAEKTLTPLGSKVTLPVNKSGKVLPAFSGYVNVLREKLESDNPKLKGDIEDNSVNLNSIYLVNTKNGFKYMATVNYKPATGDKGVQEAEIDITKDLDNLPYIKNMYPKDNASIVYGFILNKDGKTPFSKDDNYESALMTSSPNILLNHKYQIVANKENGAVKSYNVNVLIPKKGGGYSIQKVKNPISGNYDFENNYNLVVAKMNEYMATPDKLQDFYNFNNIPLQ